MRMSTVTPRSHVNNDSVDMFFVSRLTPTIPPSCHLDDESQDPTAAVSRHTCEWPGLDLGAVGPFGTDRAPVCCQVQHSARVVRTGGMRCLWDCSRRWSQSDTDQRTEQKRDSCLFDLSVCLCRSVFSLCLCHCVSLSHVSLSLILCLSLPLFISLSPSLYLSLSLSFSFSFFLSISFSLPLSLSFCLRSLPLHRGGGMSDAIVPQFGGSCPAHSLAVGGGHMAICTSDKRVFTWAMAASLSGDDGFSCGQLGHGDTVSIRKPKVSGKTTARKRL